MQIVSNHLGLHFQDSLEVLDGFFEKAIAFQIFQVADVLAQERFAATHHAHGVFQFAANRQDRLRFVFQRDGHGNKPARAAQLLRLARSDAHDGIVAPPQDVAIVNQERIGNAVQALHGLLIIDRDWLLAEVAAGHHQRLKFAAGEQQMMQRRVRQKNAQKPIAGRHAAATRSLRPCAATAQSAARAKATASSQPRPQRRSAPHPPLAAP